MGRKFRLVQRKNYSQKKSESHANLCESPTDIPATTEEVPSNVGGGSASVMQPSNVSDDEVGNSIDVQTHLDDDDIIVDCNMDWDATTSTVELSCNAKTYQIGNTDDIQMTMDNLDDDGSTVKQNAGDKSAKVSLGDLDGKTTSTTVFAYTERTMNGSITEASTQTDLADICATDAEPSIGGVITVEACTQTEPVDISESMDGDQTDPVAFTRTTATIDVNLTSGHEQQQEMPYIVCEGNADDKFLPLVNKHKGIFRDATGTYCFIQCIQFIHPFDR